MVAGNEVELSAVGREGKTAITGGGGRDDLSVASGGNMPEPEGLHAILVQYVEQIFSIRGNSGQGDVTVVGEIFDGHFLTGQSFLVRQERIDTERGGDKEEESNSYRQARTEFVFASSGDEDGTA